MRYNFLFTKKRRFFKNISYDFRDLSYIIVFFEVPIKIAKTFVEDQFYGVCDFHRSYIHVDQARRKKILVF